MRVEIKGPLEARLFSLFDAGRGVYVATVNCEHHGDMLDAEGNARALADAWNNRRHCSGAESQIMAGDTVSRDVRPCPFCGSRDLELQGRNDSGKQSHWWVACLDCSAMGPNGVGFDEPGTNQAVHKWNCRRA